VGLDCVSRSPGQDRELTGDVWVRAPERDGFRSELAGKREFTLVVGEPLLLRG